MFPLSTKNEFIMKKLIYMLAAWSFMIGISITARAQEGSLAPYYKQDGWMKAKDGYWPAMYEGKTYWYKVDQNGEVARSVNGRSWTRVEDGTWTDRAGRQIRITDNTLMWSDDNGRLWTPVPQREFRSSDGKNYKFDGGWSVWTREKQDR